MICGFVVLSYQMKTDKPHMAVVALIKPCKLEHEPFDLTVDPLLPPGLCAKFDFLGFPDGGLTPTLS